MSKIIHKPIKIPQNVELIFEPMKNSCKSISTNYNDENDLKIKGPRGESLLRLHGISLFYDLKTRELHLNCDKANLQYKGLYRSIIQSQIHGITKGFIKKLNLVGIGMKVEQKKENNQNILLFKLGKSHDVKYIVPKEVDIIVDSSTSLTINSFSKYLVGQIASDIRSFHRPDPYKGKGIRYADEEVYLKEKK
tara:strand:+ start:36 stop:614 length:579 start_codon:yes stop_codon:yes gene_type:complete